MKRVKKCIIFSSVIFLVLALAYIFLVWGRKKEQQVPEDTVKEYFSLLKDKKYEEMYELLNKDSQKKYKKEQFVTRNKNIYEGIEATDIEITINKDFVEERLPTAGEAVAYSMSMDTVAGKVSFDNVMSLKKEGSSGYRIAWESSLIFPELRDDCKVRVSKENGMRGTIFDRYGAPLAVLGDVSEVGFIPGKMNLNTKEKDIERTAEILDISVEYIEERLSAAYVKEDTFVSLKLIEPNDEEKKNLLLQIPGILINSSTARTYPYGTAAGHLTGYIRTITAEELEERKTEDYYENSMIGKYGLERAFEEELHARAGTYIFIVGPNGERENTVGYKNARDGKDVVTSIDGELQQAAYEQFSEEAGMVAAMNPKTGEILALLSTPGYEPDEFVYGISEARRKELNNMPGAPLTNRYADTWVFGPILEPITKAAGSSEEQLEKIGIGEKLPCELSLPMSTYDNGQLLINPLHLLSIYSMFVNDGNMIQPTMRSIENVPGTVWKNQAAAPEKVEAIKAELVQNVENSDGTEADAKIDGITVFGKAGTIALQSGKKDDVGAKCGWFVCGTAEDILEPIVIVGMVENIEERGGNQYLVGKIRNLVETYCR